MKILSFNEPCVWHLRKSNIVTMYIQERESSSSPGTSHVERTSSAADGFVTILMQTNNTTIINNLNKTSFYSSDKIFRYYIS